LNEKKRRPRMTDEVLEDIKPTAKQNQGVTQARSKWRPRRKQVKYGDLAACTIRVKEPRWWKGSPEDKIGNHLERPPLPKELLFFFLRQWMGLSRPPWWN
jgi:hypothetical protein